MPFPIRYPIRLLILLAFLLGAGNAVAQFNLRVDGFQPAFGPAGTAVTVTGADFSGATKVTFGTAEADFDILSDSQIRATVPPDGEIGPISVVNSFTASSAQHFTVGPRITGFDKPLAPVGDQLRIDGANFVANQTSVLFGGVNATAVTVTAPNQLFVTVPGGAVTGPVTVSTFAGTDVTATNYIIANTAVILDFDPTLGGPGTQVVLNGGDFSNVSAVSFGGVAAPFDITSISQIIATVPTGAISGLISVVTPQGVGGSFSNFTVLTPAPAFLTIDPPAGKPGEPIILGGVGLTSVTNVLFGTVDASFGVTADTQISAIVPTGAVTAPIVLESPHGNATSSVPFLVESVIEGFSPVGGIVGAVVVIDGFNLDTATYVAFNGVAANAVPTAPNQLHAVVPPGATTGPLTIGFAGGSNTTVSNFTVSAGNPVIISFSPTNGIAGQEVILSGVEFFGATNLQFNGAPAGFGVTANDQILATIPPEATSGPLTIIGPGGSNVTAGSFYLPPRLTSLSTTGAVVASQLQLVGTNFLDASHVQFTGSNDTMLDADFTVLSNSVVSAVVPTNVANGPLRVTTPGGIILSEFDFLVLPRIDRVEPLWGPVGSRVTLHGLSFEHVTDVKIGAKSCVIETNGTSYVTFIVANGADDGPITVFSAGGSSTAPADFVVTRQGDVALLLDAPNVVELGQPIILGVTVTNEGPTVATEVRATVSIPPGVGFGSASGEHFNVVPGITEVVLTWPSLTNETALTATVQLTPFIGGIFNGTVDISHLEPDMDAFNNVATYVISTASTFDRSLHLVRTNGTNVHVSWRQSPAPLTLQYTTNGIAPGQTWIDLTNIFRVTNGFVTNFVVDPVDLPRKFYRLRSE